MQSNRFPSNMFNIKIGMMHWLCDADQVIMTLRQGTGPTVSSNSVVTLAVLVWPAAT